MGLLKKATNEQAYLKAGIFGNAGTGKTTTASYLAMAISHRLGGKKPVAFFETEAGSDFLVKRFDAEGIDLLRVKSHALSDLTEAVREAQPICSCMVIDSISHVWAEVMEAKLKAVNAARKRRNLYAIDKLEFQHWADVKREWAKWTALFLNTNMHIIVCGRAGGVWEISENDETRKKEIQKVGTKMKAENEFGYEPSLLIEMDRVQKGRDVGSGWLHRAHILKDRTDTINGLKFDFAKPHASYKPGDWIETFKPFEPVFNSLNIGGTHNTYDATRTSEGLFPGIDGESRGEDRKKSCIIACEEIQGTLTALWPGQDAASKSLKGIVIESLFNTRSWTAVESKSLEELERSVGILRVLEKELKANPQITPEDLKSVIETVVKIKSEVKQESVN